MEASEDIDGLWEGLNLGGLLNDLARENESALAQAKKLQAKRDPFKKHNKMLKNPAYSAIMDRYGAAPPKPKLLAKSTLNRLSDPIKGRQIEENHRSPQRNRVVRDTKVHPRKQNKAVVSTRHRSNVSSKNHTSHERDPYNHSPIRKEAWADSSLSPTKYPRPPPSPEQDTGGGGGTGFFITGTNDEGEDYGDEDFESPPPSPAALRRKLEQGQAQGPEVSPIDLGGMCTVESPGAGARAGGYSPPDIYSPRTKEALRASFNKEQTAAPVLPPPKKSFNPLRFTDLKPEPASQPTRKTRKPLVSKPVKPVKNKSKSKTKTRASSKARGTAGHTRGSSVERQSKVGLRKSTRKTTAGDELTFDVPSKRVQLLSNKMHANKNSRASSNNAIARGRAGESGMMRSSSVKGIRSSSNNRDRGAQHLGGSRSAPSLKRRQGSGRDTSEERLPTISAVTSKPTSLPALRAKNLLGRKGVSPALQEKYSNILQSSKEACRDDPPPVKKSAPGFGASSGTGRTKTNTGALQPIMEKQGSMRKKTSTVESRKMEKKLKTRREAVTKQEEVKSPGRMLAEDKEKRKQEEKLRRDEQEKRIEARMLASKKKEEMDYRKKIREQAQENAAKSKQRDMSGSVDEKLISMFKSHCLRVTTKLSEADKLSADFKALKEFDGYSSTDRLKLRPEEDSAPLAAASSSQVKASSSATSDVKDASTAEVTSDVNVAFLSKQLMV